MAWNLGKTIMICRACFITTILVQLLPAEAQVQIGTEVTKQVEDVQLGEQGQVVEDQMQIIEEHVQIGEPYTDLEDLHRSLSETLSEMQNTLYEIKSHDKSDAIYQMSNQVSDLTVRVNNLQHAKDSLENKVSSLEAEMDCIMGRSGGCSPSKCFNGGSLISEGVCVCKEGYAGDFCEKDVNECDDSPCHNNGDCENTYGSYTCHCRFDYYGEECQYQHDDCSPDPCQNGVCMSMSRRSEGAPHFQCFCSGGWTISSQNYTCSQDINECDEIYDYCDENVVECRNTLGSYECTCPEGYFGSGKLAEEGCILLQNCSSDPCHHGQCVDLDEGFACTCESGWSGPTCSEEKNGWCSNNPCKNDGLCVEEQDLFRCECQLGFKGAYCEKHDVCERVSCDNNGTCLTDDDIHYTCQCSHGFAGTHCEGLEEACERSECSNGGECLPTNNEAGYVCSCLDNFLGDYCEDEVLYELGTCGLEGALGPDGDDCTEHYPNNSNDIEHDDVEVINGIQNVYITEAGAYRITARGSSGGSSPQHGQLGGYPAEITAVFTLQPGHLKVAVGQTGVCYKFEDLSGKKSRSVVCGGGGGTFVVTDNEPLIIAGGGGGAGDNGPGINASVTIEGTHHQPNNGALGGMLGDGGKTCPGFGGAGGAGFITSGEDGYSSGIQVHGTGGRPWPDLRGGRGDPNDGPSYGAPSYGGFGGGGRGTWCPGGGGGYSGGAGKCSRTGKGTAHKGGGGGGSLVSWSCISSVAVITSAPGPGRVTIVRLSEGDHH